MKISDEYLAKLCGLHVKPKTYDNLDMIAECIADVHHMVLQRVQSNSKNIPEWVEKNRTLKGRPFTYDNALIKMMLGSHDKELTKAPRPYLMDYLKDNCAEKVVIKSRQSEFTENELNINLFLCCHRDYTSVMHVFPTYKMGTKISSQKILPAIKESPRIYEMVKKPNISKTLTQFINGSMYLIEGSFGEMGGRASSVDKITYDEYESQSPAVEAVFDETLSHSALKLKTKISTPLLPNGGIDGEFNNSCQFEWEVECPHCGRRQIMTFPENLINYFEQDAIKINSVEYLDKLNDVYIGCKYCRTYIDRTTDFYIKTSKWVSQQPHLLGIKNGYRVTAFVMPWKTGKEILYSYHTTKYLHQFYNETLGYAYMSPEAALNRACFEQCVTSIGNAFANLGYIRNVSVGIDWGDKESWVVVRANGVPPKRNKCHVVYVERIDAKGLKRHGFAGRTEEHVDRAMQIIDFFKATIIINDANGIGKDRNSILIRNYPQRAYGVFYDTDEIEKMKRKTKIIEPQWSKDRVTVSRVGMARLLIREYMRGDVGIPQIDPIVDLFIQHHLNIGVVRRFDEKTGQEYEIVGKTGADHFCFSGDTLIMTENGEKEIKDIKAGEMVLTRKGLKKVLRSWQTGIKETKEYNICGNILRCTPEHRVWTKKGFKEIHSLNCDDVIYTIDNESMINKNFSAGNILFIEPVYNLTVQDEHEYFANGVLVSNCHADIYAKVGYDNLVPEDDICVGII